MSIKILTWVFALISVFHLETNAAESKKRMVFFDVLVHQNLSELNEQSDLLTDAFEESLTNIKELEIIPKAVRDAKWRELNLTKEDCSDESCQLQFARSAMKVDYTTSIKVRPFTNDTCFVSLKVVDTETQANVVKKALKNIPCDFDNIYATISHESRSMWPPNGQKKAPKQSTSAQRLKLGGGDLTPVPTAPTIQKISKQLSESGAISTDLDPDLIVMYYDAMDVEKAGKNRPLDAARAWEKVYKFQSSNNPYREDAKQRSFEWKKYHTAKVEKERIERERKEAKIQQKNKDTSKVKKLLNLSNFPVKSKISLVQQYVDLYGPNDAEIILGQTSLSKKDYATIVEGVPALQKREADRLEKRKKKAEEEAAAAVAAAEHYEKTHGISFQPILGIQYFPYAMWNRMNFLSGEFFTKGYGLGASLELNILPKAARIPIWIGPTISLNRLKAFESWDTIAPDLTTVPSCGAADASLPNVCDDPANPIEMYPWYTHRTKVNVDWKFRIFPFKIGLGYTRDIEQDANGVHLESAVGHIHRGTDYLLAGAEFGFNAWFYPNSRPFNINYWEHNLEFGLTLTALIGTKTK